MIIIRYIVWFFPQQFKDAISSSFSIVPVKDYNYSYLFLESKMSFHFSIFKIYFYLWFSSVCDMAMCVIFIYLSLIGVQ